MVREMERLQHALHAKTAGFTGKVARACAIIADALAVGGPWYVAFSGGIDSTVLLDLVLSARPEAHVLWGDDGADYPETLDFLSQIEDTYGVTLQRIRCMQPWRDWCIEMDAPELANDPQACEAWCNPRAWYATWDSLKDARHRGYGGVFLGLLASESRGRSRALKGGWKPLYQVKGEGGMWHASPLASWNKQDVWAYVVSRNLAYNGVYDRLASYDLPLERRRVAPLTCFRVMQYGSHVWLKQGWPQLYQRIAERFPRVRSYT